jgi:predicted aspartyl protease
MRIGATFGSLVLAALLQNGPALAEDCGPLQLITSVNLIPDGGRYLVPVTINNNSAKLLVDTGGGLSTINSGATEALGLHPIDGARIQLLDSIGNVSKKYVGLNAFTLGALRTDRIQFMVAPGSGGTGEIAGALAGDVMSLYDVELDFAAAKFNLFSQKHCPGKVIYWPHGGVAQVPFTEQRPTGNNSRTGFTTYIDRGAHIWVPVLLDGKEFHAMIDTGASRSTISAKIAKFVLGVSEDSPGSTPLGSVDGDPKHTAFGHTFSTLTFDGVTVTNPRFVVIPDLIGDKDPNNSSRTDTRVRRIDDYISLDLTVGMEVLRKLHLYVAFGERNLYITPASASQSAPAAATPALGTGLPAQSGLPAQ